MKKPTKKGLYKKDITAALKKIGFEPTDRILSAVHGIDDPTYCAKRTREILTELATDRTTLDNQVLMAARLLVLYFTLRK